MLLMGAGLALLVWLSWQYVGSTVVAQHRQADVVERLERRFDDGTSATSSEQADLPHGAFAIVRLPESMGGGTVPAVEGDDDAPLSWGLGHREHTAYPGEKGNVVLSGHRVTHGEPLRDLPDVRAGDRIEVRTAARTWTYEVLDEPGLRTVLMNDTAVLGPRAGSDAFARGSRLLTLITCAELFHTDNRLVVTAVLVP